MDKSVFALLFREAVRRTLDEADLSSGANEPVVEFHGTPIPLRRITLDETIDYLWLSSDRYYRIVDVAAFLGSDSPPVVFVRPAGFEPAAYAETWDPDDLGPFKVMGPIMRGRRV